jgi:ribosomal protein L10
VPFVIQDNIIWFQIAVDDVPFVQVFKGKQHLAQVHPRSALREPMLAVQNAAEVSARAEVKNQKEFRLCLESVVQAHNERVLRVGENVALCLCVPHQVLA